MFFPSGFPFSITVKGREEGRNMLVKWKIKAAAGLLSCGFFLFSADISGDFLCVDPVNRKTGENVRKYSATGAEKEKTLLDWASFISSTAQNMSGKALEKKELEELIRLTEKDAHSIFPVSCLAAEFRKNSRKEDKLFIAGKLAASAVKNPDAFYLASVAADMFRELKDTEKALALFRNSADYILKRSRKEKKELLTGSNKEYALYICRSAAAILAEKKEYVFCDELLSKMLEKDLFAGDTVLLQQLLLCRFRIVENTPVTKNDPLFFWLETSSERAAKAFEDAVLLYTDQVRKMQKENRDFSLNSHRTSLAILSREKYSMYAENMLLDRFLSGKENRISLLLLADYYAQKNREQLSALIWKRMLQEPFLPSVSSAFQLLAAKFSRSGSLEEMIRAQELAYMASPGRPDNIFTLARFYFLAGKKDKCYTLLSSLFPDKDALYIAALFYMQEGKHEKALSLLLEADETAGKNPRKTPGGRRDKIILASTGEPLTVFSRRQMQIALAAEKLKKYSLVEKHLKKLLSEDQGNTHALNFLGYSLADRNKELDFAQTLILLALKNEPENYAILDSLAWVKYRKNEFAEAKKYILSAVSKAEKYSLDPVIADHAADIFYALKDYEKAVEYWYKALEYYSAEVDAEKVMNKIRTTENLLKNRKK